MKREQLEAVLRLAAGEATAAELSVELGVSTNEVESWRALWLAGVRAANAPHRRPWLAATVLAASVALVVAALGARTAWAAGCASTLPAPLTTFCAGEPAVASVVNGNFAAVITGLVQKVGAFGVADVTVGTPGQNANLNVNGSQSVSGGQSISGSSVVSGNLTVNGSISGNPVVSGNLTVNGALDLGVNTVFCANSPCYCNGADYPLNWSATCNGAGVGIYQVSLVTNASSKRGFDLTCLTTAYNPVPARNVTLSCLRLKP